MRMGMDQLILFEYLGMLEVSLKYFELWPMVGSGMLKYEQREYMKVVGKTPSRELQ